MKRKDNKDKESRLLLMKISIILSSIAMLVCGGFSLYSKFVMKDNDVFVWIVMALSNFSLMFVNISNYNREKS